MAGSCEKWLGHKKVNPQPSFSIWPNLMASRFADPPPPPRAPFSPTWYGIVASKLVCIWVLAHPSVILNF